MHLLLAVENGHGQLAHLILRQADDMIGQPLRGLFAHSGQLGKLVHQRRNRFYIRHSISPKIYRIRAAKSTSAAFYEQLLQNSL